MGYRISIGFLLGLLLLAHAPARSQSTEVQQLLLNVEKLSQLKNILSDMKKGYQVVSSGYRRIKDISQGNFKLHELFLDGLLAVSPQVKKYRRIAEIIQGQKQLLSSSRAALANLRASGNFSVGELEYLSGVYGKLLSSSLEHLEELAMVITSSKLRMDDEQRLRAIDRIYLSLQDKLQFLREFNVEAKGLEMQRRSEKAAIRSSLELFNLN